MPCQTPQPWRQMKDLRDSVTLGGTERDQGSRELAGPNLRETAFDTKRKKTVSFPCSGIYVHPWAVGEKSRRK